MNKPAQLTTRHARLAADLKRWRNIKVVCVNEPDPERAAHVMRIIVNCNLRRMEADGVGNSPAETAEHVSSLSCIKD